MKLCVFSDLHFEFDRDLGEVEKLCKQIAAEQADVYVNAGDTHPREAFRKEVRSFFPEGRYVESLGNHDLYRAGVGFSTPRASIVIDGVKFAAVTLWTRLDRDEFEMYRNGLMDGMLIRPFTYEDYTKAHEEDVAFLRAEKPDVVVTHHSPSMSSCHPKWGDTVINKMFHNEMNDLVREISPALWIHGHTHDFCDYFIGKTRVLCNPRGYQGERRTGYVPWLVDI